MSDTPRTDDLHKSLVKLSEGPNWISGKDYCDMRKNSEKLERKLAAAKAWIAKLEMQRGRDIREIERLLPDARRYRKLKEQRSIKLPMIVDRFNNGVTFTDDGLDAIIDEVLKNG